MKGEWIKCLQARDDGINVWLGTWRSLSYVFFNIIYSWSFSEKKKKRTLMLADRGPLSEIKLYITYRNEHTYRFEPEFGFLAGRFMVRCGKRYKSIPTMHALLLEMHRKLYMYIIDMKFRGGNKIYNFSQ
jgi:hypothetical protein